MPTTSSALLPPDAAPDLFEWAAGLESVSGALGGFVEEVRGFREFGEPTRVLPFPDPAFSLPVFVNEFWTSRQRAASPLHEISYRACFKPQLPRFFIERLSSPGDLVYDPFMGRGTTPLEAAFLGRVPVGCDINPLSRILLEPRLAPPEVGEVAQRLADLDLARPPREALEAGLEEDLLVFYHPETLRQILALRGYLLDREAEGRLDAVDRWIRMVATNRLTGHSPGFFSVYTLPPNQATSAKAQRRINEKRQQTPPRREIAPIIAKKTRTLLGRVTPEELRALRAVSEKALLLTASADATPEIEEGSVSLVVTSPPFLQVVNYEIDNWLRCWFNGIDAKRIGIWQHSGETRWSEAMVGVFAELRRILKPGGTVAFEVGEVKRGRLLMETLVVPAARSAGLATELVLVNDQAFTKTANCWGVDNFKNGTNTNRVVLARKE